MYTFRKGSTDVTINVHLKNATTGLAETGLAYNSAGASAYYTRARAAAAEITLASLVAADSAHSDGGFKEVDGTNAKGLYRLDLPDAAVAAGVDFVVVSVEFDGVIEESVLINLSPDVNVASIDNDAITAAAVADGAIDAGAIATNAITAAKIAADVIDEIWDEAAEGAITARQMLRALLAYAAGKASGGGTTTIAFRDNADSKDRISATVDANGNRSAVTLDLG